MWMKASDAISGKEGSVIANLGGTIYEVAEMKNITAKITKKKAEFRSLGHRGDQHKATGWSGTAQATLHYGNSKWLKMMIDYIKTGKDQYFSVILTNEDPTSELGVQRVRLDGCNLDEADISKIDVDADILDMAVNFTFDDVDLLDEFAPIR